MSGIGVDSGDLIDRIREGDERALARLFSGHHDRLWRMVRARLDRGLWGRVDPDDIPQEAYLDATRRIEHSEGEDPTSSFLWLRLIVGPTMVDVHRRHLEAQMRDAGRDVPIAMTVAPGANRGSWGEIGGASLTLVW